MQTVAKLNLNVRPTS